MKPTFRRSCYVLVEWLHVVSITYYYVRGLRMVIMQAADECVSHLLVPDSGGNVARKVVTVLERSDAVVDARLKRMCAAERKDLELRHGRPVCRSLKATGACQ